MALLLMPGCCLVVVQVEEVFENLCLLTHHQDHLEHLGGKILKGTPSLSALLPSSPRWQQCWLASYTSQLQHR